MADADPKSQKIKLKYLDRPENLEKEEVARILVIVRYWVKNFDALAAGTKKINGNFRVHNFSFSLFDLSTSEDILSLPVDEDGKKIDFSGEPYLFMADLANFVEQTYFPVSNKLSLTWEQNNELNKLPHLFTIFGVAPSGNTANNEGQVTVSDIERIEDYERSQFIIRRIDEVLRILDLEEEAEQEEAQLVEEEATTAPKSGGAANLGLPFGGGGSTKPAEPEGGGGEPIEEPDRTEPDRRRSDEPPTPPSGPIKLSDLDSESKLYLQSLSIITINQALGRYFNEASLAKLGLKPGTIITFDQLPLEARRQLMDRAFLQVETLLRTGEFSLNDVIKQPSQRINFSNQAALGLLMDVHGLELLNNSVREIAKNNGKTAEKTIKKNEEQKLTDEKVSSRIKSKKDNVTTSQAAEQKIQEFADKASNAQTGADLLREFEQQLGIIHNEKQLDDEFLKQIGEITAYDARTNQRIAANARSIVELLIQQGLPPEYLIPDPDNFEYERFRNIFGDDIDRNQFNAHKQQLAALIVNYWKRKRAIWVREIRQEFGQERLTPEQAQKLYLEIKKNPAKAQAFRQLGVALNYSSGGNYVAQEMASVTDGSTPLGGEPAAGVKEAEQFAAQQKDLIAKYFEESIAKLNKKEQQKTLKVYFEFYMPGYVVAEYSPEIFQTLIVPMMSPMDLYMFNAAEDFGPGAFTADRTGWAQRAFAAGEDYQGTDFLDSAVAQKGKALAAKAIGEGLYYALDAAGGWGEALRVAEAANPWLKQLKEKLIEMGLDKVLEFIKKNWPWMLGLGALAAIGSMLPALLLLAPAAYFMKYGLSGLKNLLGIGGRGAGSIGARSNLTGYGAQQAGGIPQYPQGATTLMNQYTSSAMVTAGQAIIATVGVTAVSMFIYQTSLNSAFLTDFPQSETGLTGNTEIDKESDYAEMTKTAVIKTGCANPENNGSKCENPSFPLSIEYTITIKPKDDFSLQITDINDVIKFKQSEKGWEEAGQEPPLIAEEKILDFAFFKEIIDKQGGLSDVPLSATPTPLPTTPPEDPPVTPSGTPEGFIVIPAGSSLTFTYTLEDLSSDYNHTAITNIIEANFYYQNAFISGNDNLITSARVCLGECSGQIGCWPMSATLTTLPFEANSSHNYIDKNGNHIWLDAYDMANGSKQDLYGEPVYAPFDGEFCHAGCSDEGYGCYNTLEFEADGSSYFMLFAHFQDPPDGMGAGSCKTVEAGYQMGLSGNRGLSTANHLHFSVARTVKQGYNSDPGVSILETLMPPDDENNQPAKLLKHVTSCYDL